MILLNIAGLARPVRIDGEVLLGDGDGLVHLLLGLEQGLVDHGSPLSLLGWAAAVARARRSGTSLRDERADLLTPDGAGDVALVAAG